MIADHDAYQRALAQVYARVPLGMRLGLAGMEAACLRLGRPERAFAAVHVAGTNGKGSVCAMVEAIARRSGLRTGLFTSPHLTRFAERIRIDGEPISDAALLPILETALTVGADLTFFETVTLAAFLAFKAAKVDLAVVEVGLGGRLDATNVIPAPRAAAITRIAFDHTDRLGGTLVEIAREKAGIAKPGLDLVLGPVSPEVREAIDLYASAAGATTSAADDDEEAVEEVAAAKLGLLGAHQRENARVAWVLGRRAGASIEACREGLASARWAARLESVDTAEGRVLLDAAHNPDGVASLVAYLAASRSERGEGEVAVVFGALADKAWAEMQDLLAKHVARRFYVVPKGRAAVPLASLVARHPGEPEDDLVDALRKARRAVGRGGLVVVAGSILLVGEARAHLLGLPRDPPVGM